MAKIRRRKTKVQRLIIYFKKTLAFLLSHVGLCILVVGYTILGSFVFKSVEGPHEVQIQHTVKSRRRRAVNAMWEATYVHNVLEPDIWSEKVALEVDGFRRLLMYCIRRGYDGIDNIDNSQFTMAGAYLYSLAVITTIGYGNIACRTYLGKALTIGYAIIGVPLMLLFLTNIGDVFAKIFTFMYRFSAKLKLKMTLWYKGRRLLDLHRKILTPGLSTSRLHNHQRERDDVKAGEFRHNTRSTDERGRSHAAWQEDTVQSKVSIVSFPGLTTTMSEFYDADDKSQSKKSLHRSVGGPLASDQSLPWTLPAEGIQSSLTTGLRKSAAGRRRDDAPDVELVIGSKATSSDRKAYDFLMRDLSTIGQAEAEEKIGRQNVPMWLVLFTMIGYLVTGALIFALWEKWDFLDVFYFCFVSLTTVGFSDLFPGLSVQVDDRSTQDKLAITSFYLLFGMALIAMCFSLAQEQVVGGVTRLALRFGMLKRSKNRLELAE